MQYKYNKNTDSLELVNKNIVIVNNNSSIEVGNNSPKYAIGDILFPKTQYAVGGCSITWQDPEDIINENKYIAKWDKTIVIRKEDAPPLNLDDGVIIIENNQRNQYKDTPYLDETAEFGKTYFYRFFTFTDKKACTIGKVSIASPDISWANATDSEIAAVVALSDIGAIDLHNDLGWNIGDERVIRLPAIEGSNGVGSQPAQEITLVLMNAGGFEFVNPKNTDRTECAFVVGMKDCLYNAVSLGSFSGSYIWRTCGFRTWIQEKLYEAIPSELKPIFKPVYVKTGLYDDRTVLDVTEDILFLPSQREVLSAEDSAYIVDIEKKSLNTFTYYEIPENRIKSKPANEWQPGTTMWYTRSPSTYRGNYGNPDYEATIKADGTAGWDRNNGEGISFIGCI